MESPRSLKETLNRLLIKLLIKEKTGEVVIDEQTGEPFELETEVLWDIAAATLSTVYLVALLIFFCWELLDIHAGQNVLLRWLFPQDSPYPDSPLCRLIAYTAIGGGLGGIVNGFRSLITWHAERKAFGWRFMWKYVILPLLGAVLAVIVYTIVRCGIGVFGGSFALEGDFTNQALSAFAVGALSGYGSQKVFKWLDEHVNRLFSIAPVEVKVPDLTGENQKEAETTLKKSGLKLGKVEQKVGSDETKIGKVVNQEPRSGSKISRGESVDITIAKKGGTK